MSRRTNRPADILIPGHPRGLNRNIRIVRDVEPQNITDRDPARVTLLDHLDSNVAPKTADQDTITDPIMSEQAPAHVDTVDLRMTEAASANMIDNARPVNTTARGQHRGRRAQSRRSPPADTSTVTTGGPQRVTLAHFLARTGHQDGPDTTSMNMSREVDEVLDGTSAKDSPGRAAPVFQKRFSGADWNALPDKLAEEDAAAAAFFRAMPRNNSPSKETTFNQTYHKTTHTSDLNSRKIVNTEQTTFGGRPEDANTQEQVETQVNTSSAADFDTAVASKSPEHQVKSVAAPKSEGSTESLSEDVQEPKPACSEQPSLDSLIKDTLPSTPNGNTYRDNKRSSLFEIKGASGKGLGVFAIEPLPCGTRLLTDKPLMRLSEDEYRNVDYKNVLAKFNALSAEDRTKYKSIYSKSEFRSYWQTAIEDQIRLGNSDPKEHLSIPDQAAVMAVFETNTIQHEDGGAYVCHLSSRMNHSCSANAIMIWNSNLDAQTVHLIRDVKKHEEITVAYFNDLQTRQMRRETLESHFGYACRCPACDPLDSSHTESEFRRARILNLDRVILWYRDKPSFLQKIDLLFKAKDFKARFNGTYTKSWHEHQRALCLELVWLFKQEGLNRTESASALKKAAVHSKAIGDHAKASKCAKDRLELWRMFAGDDHEETKKAYEFLMEMSTDNVV
ncbi:hypothetical protein LTS18_010677 [Coniosporium uncinatum]|uniref:Uncharacterized protein n=1 Tax=Coniosporium uncinatum TaxID=93489 RepID=A0ACC3DW73_9PEZI|nr:hypothetical protein LTS18_010677 [Coniosporium uncinatum]